MKIGLLALLFVVLFQNIIDAKTYYISASGDDENSGTSQTSPWRTISKLNSFFSNIVPGDSILFNRGDEFYGTINITKSGTSLRPIVLGAYGVGVKPVITGFTAVSDWKNVGTNIWESAEIANGPTKLNMLTINGRVTAMGRFPNATDKNKGYLSIDSRDSSLSITDGALPSTPNWTGGEVVIRRTRWILDRDSITNHTGTTIYYKAPSATAVPANGYGYFIQNHPGTLDKDGEWYYNPISKTVKIYSSSAPSSIKISTLSNLVTAVDISYVKLEILNFTGANKTAINITGTGTTVSIINCDISASGIQGINVSSNKLLLDKCTVAYSLNKAIDVSGWSSIIRNCVIKNTGAIAGMGGSGNNQYYGVVVSGRLSVMELCQVDSSGFIPIHLNSDSSTIRNNLINTFCFVKDDGAAIYTYNGATDYVWKRRRITGNIILNGIGAKEGTTSSNLDAFGIYLDDKSNNVEVTDNTISNVSHSGLYLHNAHEITITRNTFYNNNVQVRMVHDAIAPNDPIRNVVVKNNIEFAKTTTQLVGYYGSRTNDIARFGTLDSNYYCRPILEPNKITSTSSTTGGIIDIVINNAAKYLSLDRWTDSTGHDLSSRKTSKTVSDTSKIRFEYNASAEKRTISLGEDIYIGVDSTRYSESITLQPYASIILLKDSLVKVTALSATSLATAILCNGGTATVTVSAAGGKTPYTGTGTFTAAAGTHNYTVTDANGATATTSITVTEPTELKASSEAGTITAAGGTTTVIVSASGGTAPYTGTGEFTKEAGTYKFTVTDANGCTDATSITISEAAMLYASSVAGKIACFGGTTIVAVSASGGTPPYTGTGDFTQGAGSYTFTVTDANGATATTTGTISQPAASLEATSSGGAINCFGGTTTVSVSPTGGTPPYTGTGNYTVGAGVYNYSVTDANGCIATTSITITQPAVISPSVNIPPIACNGGTTSISVTATGGRSPYSYSLNGGQFQTSNTFNNIKAGNYKVAVKDAANCTVDRSGTITQPSSALQATVVKKSSPTCKGGSNGSIQVAASGGTSPYVYSINNSTFTSNSTFSSLKAGTYTIIAKDFNGCTVSLSVSLVDGKGLCKTSARGVRQTTDSSVSKNINTNVFKITAFPNPSESRFILSISGNKKDDVRIQVTNLFGVKLYEIIGKIDKQYVFGENFVPGVYFLRVAQGEDFKILKLIKL